VNVASASPVLPENIATSRLALRPFCFDDVDAVLSYANDEEWSRYMGGVPYPYQCSDAIQFLARHVLLDRAVHAAWAVVVGEDVVGGMNIRFRLDYQVADIGWSLHRRLWGQGLATEAARAVVDSAFRTHVTLKRIAALADLRNVASFRVMEKLGMRREGTLRQNRVSRGALIDEVYYGLLREEWLQ
jgi:ribosomal-protein-alanine N-acetyltransferase